MNTITHYKRKAPVAVALLLAIFCMAGASASAQVNKRLSKAEMKTDIDYFFNTLRQHHPNPYFFCSKDSVEREKSKLESSLPDSLCTYDFAKRIGTLNHLFDSHTTILFNFFYQDTTIRVLPKIIELNSNDEVYIRNKFTSSSTRVTAINGYPTKEVMTRLNSYFTNEKIIPFQSVKKSYLRRYINLLNINPPFTFTIAYKDTSATVNITDQHLFEDKRVGYKLDFTQCFKHNKDLDEIDDAVMKINTKLSTATIYYFSCNINNNEAVQKKMKTFFDTLNTLHIKNLIIDIRNNTGGGDESNDIITNYIKHSNFHIKQNYEGIVDPEAKKEAIEYVDTYRAENLFNRVFYHLLIPNHILLLKELPVGDKYRCKVSDEVERCSKGYSGNIFIVQGASTCSAAADFSYWFKKSKRGVLVGEETGEATDCFSNALENALPNSQLSFMVAQGRYTLPNGSVAKGVEPDFYFKTDRYDIFLSESEIRAIISFKK
ncbi:S41 family peptidase [uncultured Acetobacteroides sp.]|uniref:S41 family peptidase n=1 Tax=uncultured Acetobacteroides sp. TaxID=1760811 RepID=UPI0029F4D16C|nr:S41 family peptidase [uncultured Acetobacteroides sp.]